MEFLRTIGIVILAIGIIISFKSDRVGFLVMGAGFGLLAAEQIMSGVSTGPMLALLSVIAVSRSIKKWRG